jgi:hypothetical protein
MNYGARFIANADKSIMGVSPMDRTWIAHGSHMDPHGSPHGSPMNGFLPVDLSMGETPMILASVADLLVTLLIAR